MTLSGVLRTISRFATLGAKVADGAVPAPEDVIGLVLDSACDLGCSLDELRDALTPGAIMRVQVEREASLRRKVGGG